MSLKEGSALKPISCFAIAILLALIPIAAYGEHDQGILRMNYYSGCVRTSPDFPCPHGEPPVFTMVARGMPTLFQAELHAPTKIMAAYFVIESPDGKFTFEAPLTIIEGNGPKNIHLQLNNEIFAEASRRFVPGSRVTVSFGAQTESVAEVVTQVSDGSSVMALTGPHGPPIPHGFPDGVQSSSASQGLAGPHPHGPHGLPGPQGHAFDMIADEMPVKFQLTSHKTVKLLSADCTIESPDGKSTFVAPLSIKRNGSTTVQLSLNKMIPEVAKHFVPGSHVVVSFRTEKEIKPETVEMLAAGVKTKF